MAYILLLVPATLIYRVLFALLREPTALRSLSCFILAYALKQKARAAMGMPDILFVLPRCKRMKQLKRLKNRAVSILASYVVR